ncbi:MAG TPA: proton-conducting transporter membrane subunit [Prosthecobacter sp.]
MDTLSLPFLSTGILALFTGSALAWCQASSATHRRRSILFAAAAVVCFCLADWNLHSLGHPACGDAWLPWLEVTSLNAVPLIFFSVLTLFYIALAPKRDAGGRSLSGMLFLAAATAMAYSSGNLLVLLAGWWLTCVPFVGGFFGKFSANRVISGFLIASCVALTASVFFLHATHVEDLSHASAASFGLLLLAVILRKGVFPVHSWVVAAFESGPLLAASLLFNSHLGALVVARSEMVTLPHIDLQLLDVLSIAAMATSLITSLRACVEKKPRRLLAYICLSQAGFILAGIATANAEGITGALLHWLVVTAASSGLVAIVRILEVRVSDVTDPAGNLGLAVKAPRLATFFLLCGLALIGLPGTLGYCAEDLLFHGALENHPFLGIALPVATAFNAINLLRLFGLLFLGVLPKHVIDIPDALPRERWPLAACMLFLVFGGILPGVVISWRAPAAEAIARSIRTEEAH